MEKKKNISTREKKKKRKKREKKNIQREISLRSVSHLLPKKILPCYIASIVLAVSFFLSSNAHLSIYLESWILLHYNNVYIIPFIVSSCIYLQKKKKKKKRKKKHISLILLDTTHTYIYIYKMYLIYFSWFV